MKKSLLILAIVLTLGTSCTTSPPINKEALTRGEAMQIIFDFFAFNNYENTTTFDDISGKPYAEAVVWAQHSNSLSWIDGRSFEGDKVLARYECAAILSGCYADLYEHSLERIHSDDANITRHFDQIRKWPNFGDIPDWAIDYVLFAEGYSLLFGDLDVFEPLGYITEAELLYALDLGFKQTLEISGFSTQPNEVDYSKLGFSHTGTSQLINLGMNNDSLSSVTDMPIEGNWLYRLDGIEFIYLPAYQRGFVSSICIYSSFDSPWRVNGLSANDAKTETELVFGTAAEFVYARTWQNAPRFNTGIYFYDANGDVVSNRDDAAYYLVVEYNDDDSIYSISALCYYPFNELGLPISEPVLGGLCLFSQGSGDSVIKNNGPMRVNLDIDYKGSGDFSILQGDKVLFSCTGQYKGVVLAVTETLDDYTVQADGEWLVKGYYRLSQTHRYEGSGSGDYVIPVLGFFGHYRVSYQGPGPFEVRLVPWQTDPNTVPPDMVIANSMGDTTKVIDLSDIGMLYCDVVITCDGDWVFEQEFDLVVVSDID
ncbi:MAG: hypothetical protein FWH40_00260 [Coriobacteriia bacterium]|nr:hypothetical protein [Coriobacteriia bacterium]